MSIFDSIEKLITEHGSAAILTQQLSFARDQFSDMERKLAELQKHTARLEVEIERERSEHKQAREDLQQLKDEHAEEVRINHGIEFRRGKRTGGNWLAFCPKCHMPAYQSQALFAPHGSVYPAYVCSASCGWQVFEQKDVDFLIRQLK